VALSELQQQSSTTRVDLRSLLGKFAPSDACRSMQLYYYLTQNAFLKLLQAFTASAIFYGFRLIELARNVQCATGKYIAAKHTTG
jgi:hypothetical protein